MRWPSSAALLVALVTVVAVVTVTAAFDCPSVCTCGYAGDQREYACELPSGNVTITAVVNSHADLTCTGGVLRCSELPFISVARNGSLSSFSVSQCELAEPLRCVLAALGATDAAGLMVRAATNALRAHHVAGLDGLRSLRLVDAAAQSSVPYDVLRSLPSLTDFRLRGAELTLSAAGFGDVGRLQHVELSSDRILHLPPAAFTGLEHLPQLHLWDNRIESFDPEAFRGLESLERLDLSRNRLRALPTGGFMHTPRLKQLTFFANPLQEIAPDAFTGLLSLEKLISFDNRADLKLSPRALANLPALVSVRLTKCRIYQLSPDTFHNSSSITSLQLGGNSISDLPAGLFRDQSKLESLLLNDNKIQSLRPDVFWPLKQLKELSLDKNLIEVLPGQLFSGLTRLKSIRMTSNRLTQIAPDAFIDAVALEAVHLANNSLTLRPPGLEPGHNVSTYEEFEQQSPFSSLLQLKELDLSRNAISIIFSDWRFVLLNLKKLNLAWNRIRELTGADIQFLGSEVVIDLRHNNITTVEVMDMPSYLAATTASVTESKVLLDDNPFNCDCNMYSFIRRLRGLSAAVTAEPTFVPDDARCAAPGALEGRSVAALQPDVLTCELPSDHCPDDCSCDLRPATSSLEVSCLALPALPDPASYGMASTRLRLLRPPPDLSALPHHVAALNLSGAGLTRAPPVPSTVRELDLTRNLLASVPPELLRADARLRLADNPLGCDCEHAAALAALQAAAASVADAARVRCGGGESPWAADARRACAVRRAAALGGALAALGAALALAAAAACRYADRLKVLAYSRGWLRWMLREEDADRDKEYDAFVSFSHKDARFVAERLVPALEGGPRPLRLCLHYRDWVVGEWIPAQIASSVEKSRRTIVVLSEHFVDSVWGKMEFRVAHQSAQKEKRSRVVVVLLEDAPPADRLDAELRAYLDTNTYVKWGDPWFWEKMNYALAGRRVDEKAAKRARLVGEKITKGGLNARINSEGKLVNDNQTENVTVTPPCL